MSRVITASVTLKRLRSDSGRSHVGAIAKAVDNGGKICNYKFSIALQTFTVNNVDNQLYATITIYY